MTVCGIPIIDRGLPLPGPQQNKENEGVEFLCEKYSSLITQLRGEVAARQTAQAELRASELRFRDEVAQREADRARWEEERRALHHELTTFRLRQREAADLRNAEVLERQRSAAASVQLSARCEKLQEAQHHEAQRAQQAMSQVVAGSGVVFQQGKELTRLREEQSEFLAQRRDAHTELGVYKEHVDKWRRATARLEGSVEAATHGRDEAEATARALQEELRRALRSVSVAKQREIATALSAKKAEHELRSREARLAAVRQEGQRHARRAESCQQKLAAAEVERPYTEQLTADNERLRSQLERESAAIQRLQAEVVRTQAGECRAAGAAQEAQHELREQDRIGAQTRQQVVELGNELSRARARFELIEQERTTGAALVDNVRAELNASREDREEVRFVQDNLRSELTEARRRIDRSTPQLSESKRRLGDAENAVARSKAEILEERRARERCHVDTIRTGEKLRTTRGQADQLRARVRTLEEERMKYPSRRRRCVSVPGSRDEVRVAPIPHVRSSTDPIEFEEPRPLAICAKDTTADMVALREFIVRKEQWLGSDITGTGFVDTCRANATTSEVVRDLPCPRVPSLSPHTDFTPSVGLDPPCPRVSSSSPVRVSAVARELPCPHTVCSSLGTHSVTAREGTCPRISPSSPGRDGHAAAREPQYPRVQSSSPGRASAVGLQDYVGPRMSPSSPRRSPAATGSRIGSGTACDVSCPRMASSSPGRAGGRGSVAAAGRTLPSVNLSSDLAAAAVQAQLQPRPVDRSGVDRRADHDQGTRGVTSATADLEALLAAEPRVLQCAPILTTAHVGRRPGAQR